MVGVPEPGLLQKKTRKTIGCYRPKGIGNNAIIRSTHIPEDIESYPEGEEVEKESPAVDLKVSRDLISKQINRPVIASSDYGSLRTANAEKRTFKAREGHHLS